MGGGGVLPLSVTPLLIVCADLIVIDIVYYQLPVVPQACLTQIFACDGLGLVRVTPVPVEYAVTAPTLILQLVPRSVVAPSIWVIVPPIETPQPICGCG